MTNLSEHFTVEEATHSSTAIRAGIDNTPTDEQLSNMKVAATGMEQVRAKLGAPINVDSWLRVEELEKILTVKDFPNWCKLHDHDETDPASWTAYFQRKAHPEGFAVDFTCPQYGTPADIVKCLAASGIKFDQLIMEGTWVHISFDPRMRGIVMAATFVKGVPTYTNA